MREIAHTLAVQTTRALVLPRWSIRQHTSAYVSIRRIRQVCKQPGRSCCGRAGHISSNKLSSIPISFCPLPKAKKEEFLCAFLSCGLRALLSVSNRTDSTGEENSPHDHTILIHVQIHRRDTFFLKHINGYVIKTHVLNRDFTVALSINCIFGCALAASADYR